LSDIDVQNIKNIGLNWFAGFNNGIGRRSNMLPDSFSGAYTIRNAGIIRLRGLLALPRYHLNMHAPTARHSDNYGTRFAALHRNSREQFRAFGEFHTGAALAQPEPAALDRQF
jgi:hypothetical protein